MCGDENKEWTNLTGAENNGGSFSKNNVDNLKTQTQTFEFFSCRCMEA